MYNCTAIVNAEFYQSHGRVTVCTNGHLLKMGWNAKLLIFLGVSSWKKAVPLLKNYGRYDMAKLWLITVPELKRPHHPWNRFILVWVCNQIVQWTEKFQFLITHNSSVMKQCTKIQSLYMCSEHLSKYSFSCCQRLLRLIKTNKPVQLSCVYYHPHSNLFLAI